MKKFAIAMSLLAMMTLTVSCTKDSDAKDGISKNFTDCYKPEPGDGQDRPDGSPQGEKGTNPPGEKADNGCTNSVYDVPKHYYYGTWKINDADVEADNFLWLWCEYGYQLPDLLEKPTYDPNNTYNYIEFNAAGFGEYIVSFYEFPIKQLILDVLPETDIAALFFYHTAGGEFNEIENFWHTIYIQYREEEGDRYRFYGWRTPSMNPIGLSENALYYEIKGPETSVYERFVVVIMTKDGDYFGVSFNVVYHKSILVYDRQSEMISLSIKIASIDIIDKDGTRTTRNLNPEYTVTFTSNAIKDKINLGN